MPAAKTTSRDLTAEVAFLTRALKAPTCANQSLGWPSAPARNPGRTRSSWLPACNEKSQRANHTVVKAASAPPAFQHVSRWRSLTSTTLAA